MKDKIETIYGDINFHTLDSLNENEIVLVSTRSIAIFRDGEVAVRHLPEDCSTWEEFLGELDDEG